MYASGVRGRLPESIPGTGTPSSAGAALCGWHCVRPVSPHPLSAIPTLLPLPHTIWTRARRHRPITTAIHPRARRASTTAARPRSTWSSAAVRLPFLRALLCYAVVVSGRRVCAVCVNVCKCGASASSWLTHPGPPPFPPPPYDMHMRGPPPPPPYRDERDRDRDRDRDFDGPPPPPPYRDERDRPPRDSPPREYFQPLPPAGAFRGTHHIHTQLLCLHTALAILTSR